MTAEKFTTHQVDSNLVTKQTEMLVFLERSHINVAYNVIKMSRSV